jgi:hypothetical protein
MLRRQLLAAGPAELCRSGSVTEPSRPAADRARPRPRGPAMHRESPLPDAASLAVTGALGAIVALGITGPGRVVLALLFVAYVPGRAVVANWPAARARSAFALPMVLSLAIVALVSTIALWLQAWYPTYQFAAIAALSAGAIATALVRRGRP